MRNRLSRLSAAALFLAVGAQAGFAATAPQMITGKTKFTVTVPNAPNSVNINGAENPSLTLKRGKTYTFKVNAEGHPFYIMSTQGNDTTKAYKNGVTGNGSEKGNLIFVVPKDAPDTLYYDCGVHLEMTGKITITN
jgi:hypothetical protein